jgi:hypothetical protein
MRPLHIVDPKDLRPGKMYLIREKRPEYAHLNSKGIFVKNDYPISDYHCTISHFTNVMITGNVSIKHDLTLQDSYWNYYEADAVERSYITQALREITGDPEFIFDNY